MPSVDKDSSSSSKSSEAKSSITKPVFKFIAFEDTSATGYGTKKYHQGVKSWTNHKMTETWMDQTKVDRAIKDHPAEDYITAYFTMGPKRRALLDGCLQRLNEADSTSDMVGYWEPEHLYPGKDVVDKRTGARVRTPTTFWVIVKRMRKASALTKQEESKGPKSILVKSGNNSDGKGDWSRSDKSSGERDKNQYQSKGDNDKLVQQLIHAMTQMNTNSNGISPIDVQNQIQTQIQIAFMRQNQPQGQYMQPQLTPPPPYQEHGLPMSAHNGLPQAPMAPSSSMFNNPYGMGMPSRHPQEHSPQLMNGSFNTASFNGHPNSPYGYENPYSLGQQQQQYSLGQQQQQLRRSASRSRRAEEEEDLFRNTHLNASEPPVYPRGGAGSRRHSSVSFGQYYQDDMSQGKYAGQFQDMHMPRYMPQRPGGQPLSIMPNPNMEPQQLRRLEAWTQATSTNSDCSDEDRGRSGNRGDSVYSRARSRSASRSNSRMVDLSGGGRRHSISYPGMQGHHQGIAMGKGFGVHDSDDEMSMHHGMSINRSLAPTPFLGMRT